MREIKFRVWDKEDERFAKNSHLVFDFDGNIFNLQTGEDEKELILLQYTGLKDKNGLTEVYEGDIIDSNGKVKGNIHETSKEKADLVIQGFGTKTWCSTYKKAMDRGCNDA